MIDFEAYVAAQEKSFKQQGYDTKPLIKKKKPPPPPKQQPNLFDDFEQASGVLDDAMAALGNQIIEGNIIDSTLFKTTPGIGKTEAAIHLACQMAKNGKVCFFSSATRDMCWQIYDRIKGGFFGEGLRAIVVDGRHDGYPRTKLSESGGIIEIPVKHNCYHYNKVKLAHEYGYPVYKYVCANCPSYPRFKDANGSQTKYKYACPYYKRMWEAAGWVPVHGPGGSTPIFLMTHHMMANFHTDSEVMKDRMDLAIYDEDPTVALRTTYSWSEEEVKKKIIHQNMKPFRDFLDFVMYIADFYRLAAQFVGGEKYYKTEWKNDECMMAFKNARYMDSTILSGKSLALLLKHCAELNKVDLMGLLEMTSTMDTGIDKGQLLDFNVSQAHVLPHYKEPELANELKNIVLDAEKGEESAYKVSLRWDPFVPYNNKDDDKKPPPCGWNVFWDEVRQINFGKSLIQLDAYGDKIIVDRIMGRPVDVREVHCKVRKNVIIKIFPEVNTSKKSMNANKDQIFNTYVDPELRMLKGGKILFYIQKCYIGWLKKRIDKGNYGFETAVIKYFWQDRGDDSYGDFDNLCMVGTPISNIVGERNFCNALFHGEAPIDWSTGIGYVPNDPRVKAHLEARQEKEMLQALFRLRPSKPRDNPQNILIFSNMKLPIEFEMPGATTSEQKKPSVDKSGIVSTIKDVFGKYGCWTDYFISFYAHEEEIFDWFDAGGLDSGEDFPLTYEELGETFKRMANKKAYIGYRDSILKFAMSLECKEVDYQGKKVRCFGDKEKLIEILDVLKGATRAAGVDEEPYEPPEGPEAEQAPGGVESATEAPAPENEQSTGYLGSVVAENEVNANDTDPSKKGKSVGLSVIFGSTSDSDDSASNYESPQGQPFGEQGIAIDPDPPPDEA